MHDYNPRTSGNTDPDVGNTDGIILQQAVSFVRYSLHHHSVSLTEPDEEFCSSISRA